MKITQNILVYFVFQHRNATHMGSIQTKNSFFKQKIKSRRLYGKKNKIIKKYALDLNK